MANLEDRTCIRLPKEFTDRAEALVEAMGRDRTYVAMGKITAAAVFRQAILEGLNVLEKRYKLTRRKRR